MRAPVISGCNAPPVLEFAEHILHFMACFVEFFAIAGRIDTVLSVRDARLDPLCPEGGPEFIAVIALVADQVRSAWRQAVIDDLCAGVVAHLTFAQKQDHRLAMFIHDRVQF